MRTVLYRYYEHFHSPFNIHIIMRSETDLLMFRFYAYILHKIWRRGILTGVNLVPNMWSSQVVSS